MQRINLNDTYIGVYDTNGNYRIGLFVKDEIVPIKNEPFSAQYYRDLLSNTKTALLLDENGKDRQCDFSHPLSNDPEERVNWNGVRGTVSSVDTDSYQIPTITGEVDRHLSLVQFTSVYPNLVGQVSIEKVVECLADYCSKFELKDNANKQILDGLKEIPQYLASKGSDIPTFENIPLNEIDLSQIPEDFNTIKHR